MKRTAVARAGRGAVNVGVGSLATGALLEWVAPLWAVLPDWMRVLASANEAMMIAGAALMIGGAIVGRRARHVERSEPRSGVVGPGTDHGTARDD